MRNRTIYLLAVLLLGGCVKLPAPQLHTPAEYLHATSSDRDSLPHDIAWWKCFGDTLLNRLELEALARNRSLAEAASRVEAARLNRRAARAAYLPQLDLKAGAEAGYTSPNIDQEYTLAPALSWELPLFGAMKATREAAQANIAEQEWLFRGAGLSLTGEVATSYFTLLGYLRSLEIADRTRQLRQEALALTDSLLRYGMTTALERDQAQSLLLTAASDVEQYERLALQSYFSLQILLGESPQPIPELFRGERLERVVMPPEVPVGLPSDLLHRRPDVLAQLYAMEGAAARVGVARAARFPSLSLTAEGGLMAEFVRGIRSGEPWFWSAAASVTGPLFGFGRLKAEEQIARESYMQALLSYEDAVLQAIADVDKALVGVASSRRQMEKSEALVGVNRRIADQTRALYRNGMSPYLDVIDAQRSYYETQMQLISLRVSCLEAYVDLYKALGGGW